MVNNKPVKTVLRHQRRRRECVVFGYDRDDVITSGIQEYGLFVFQVINRTPDGEMKCFLKRKQVHEYQECI